MENTPSVTMMRKRCAWASFELFFKVFHVCVGITITYCFAEPYAVDDGCVVERVGDDGILVREERFEYASVRIEACGVEDGVLRTEILRNGGFEAPLWMSCVPQMKRTEDMP